MTLADMMSAAMFPLWFAGQEATQPEVHPMWTAQEVSNCSSCCDVRQRKLQVTPAHSCWRGQLRQSAVSSLLGKSPPRPVSREQTMLLPALMLQWGLFKVDAVKLNASKLTTASSVDRRLFSRDILAGRSQVPSVISRCWRHL